MHVNIDNMFCGVSSNEEMFISLMTSTEERGLESVSTYVNACNIYHNMTPMTHDMYCFLYFLYISFFIFKK